MVAPRYGVRWRGSSTCAPGSGPRIAFAKNLRGQGSRLKRKKQKARPKGVPKGTLVETYWLTLRVLVGWREPRVLVSPPCPLEAGAGDRGLEPGAHVLEPLHLTPYLGATTGRSIYILFCLSLSFFVFLSVKL